MVPSYSRCLRQVSLQGKIQLLSIFFFVRVNLFISKLPSPTDLSSRESYLRLRTKPQDYIARLLRLPRDHQQTYGMPCPRHRRGMPSQFAKPRSKNILRLLTRTMATTSFLRCSSLPFHTHFPHVLLSLFLLHFNHLPPLWLDWSPFFREPSTGYDYRETPEGCFHPCRYCHQSQMASMVELYDRCALQESFSNSRSLKGENAWSVAL